MRRRPAICGYLGHDGHIAWVIVDYKTDRIAASQISSNDPMRFSFTVRDLLWLTCALALATHAGFA